MESGNIFILLGLMFCFAILFFGYITKSKFDFKKDIKHPNPPKIPSKDLGKVSNNFCVKCGKSHCCNSIK